MTAPYVTLWFTKRETETIYQRYRFSGAAATVAVAAVCGATAVLTSPAPPVAVAIIAVCAAIGLYIQDFTNNLTQAHERKRCLTVNIRPVGFNPLNPLSALTLLRNGKLALLDFDDKGGRECKP